MSARNELLGRTARVALRRLRPSDEGELVGRVRASRKHLRPWIYGPEDGEAFATYLARSRDRDFEALVLCARDEGAVVRRGDRSPSSIAGIFNLSQICLGGFCSAYLGFYALVPFAGRGLMREGLELVLRFAFGPVGLHRVEANVQPGNERSLRLVEAAGFKREGFSPRYLKIGGRWRDHVRLAALADDAGRAKR